MLSISIRVAIGKLRCVAALRCNVSAASRYYVSADIACIHLFDHSFALSLSFAWLAFIQSACLNVKSVALSRRLCTAKFKSETRSKRMTKSK